MAWEDLHEGILSEFAEASRPATVRRNGRFVQSATVIDRAERKAAIRRVLQRMADVRYEARNPERARARHVRYRESKPDKVRASSAAHRERNRRALAARALARYYANHEENKRRQRERAREKRLRAG